MSDEISKLPPRAFGSIVDMLTSLRGKDGMVQNDIQLASALLQHVDPALSERLRRISIAQQSALNKADGR